MKKEYINKLMLLIMFCVMVSVNLSLTSCGREDSEQDNRAEKQKNDLLKSWMVFMDKVEKSLNDEGINSSSLDHIKARRDVDYLDEEVYQGGVLYGKMSDIDEQGNSYISIICMDDDGVQYKGVDWEKWPFWTKCMISKHIENGMDDIGITEDMLKYIIENGEYDSEDEFYTIWDKKNKLYLALKYNINFEYMTIYRKLKKGDKGCMLTIESTKVEAGYYHYPDWNTNFK